MANAINALFGRVVNMEKLMSKLESKRLLTAWRTIDGSYNNLEHPSWGKTHISLLRQSPTDYGDNLSTLSVRGVNNPNPRIISNLLCKTNVSKLNSNNLTDMMWIWGQFIDHELDLTQPSSTSPESANMITPTVIEDPNEDYPDRTILFNRSMPVINSSPRQQLNKITCYIDASNVYGSDSIRSYGLRMLDGSGKLKVDYSDNSEVILPYNINELENEFPNGLNPRDFFVAGDVRSNENIYLTAMHTLFVREHNRLCDIIRKEHKNYVEEDIYQHSRRLVSGMMQYITYNEFLPNLLGDYSKYSGYNKDINPSIKTEFSTVGYRLGHSMLSSQLKTGSTGTILLRDTFFNSSYISQNGVDNLLLGGMLNIMQEIDIRVVEDIRSFLFGAPTSMNLLDLVSLNIQRGRDHGITDYNTLRASYGLSKKNNFKDITSNTTVKNGLSALYNSVNDIDPWIGALCEDYKLNSNVGELLDVILREQFDRIRAGDRYYYRNDNNITASDIKLIESSTLDKIIERNTSLNNLGNAFKL